MKCRVDECDQFALSKGYCNKHYLQIRAHGKITDVKRIEVRNYTCLVCLYDKNKVLAGKAIIDKEDFDLIKRYTWRLGSGGYVVSKRKVSDPKGPSIILLHRLILGVTDSSII